MAVTSDRIGVAGNAFYHGIPVLTLNWTGRSGTARAATIFGQVTKSAGAEVATVNDLNGERLESKRRNKTIQFRFGAKPKGATSADALVIAGDLPQVMDKVTITGVAATETDLPCDGTTDTCVVDSCEGTYSPEGEFVMDITVTKWIGKVYADLT